MAQSGGIEEIRKQVTGLVASGDKLVSEVADSEDLELLEFRIRYQRWYSQALSVIRRFLPERLSEFSDLYSVEKRKEIDFLTYSISDFLLGVSIVRNGKKINSQSVAFSRIHQQVSILASVSARIDEIASGLLGVLAAELYDTEIVTARALLKVKHLRAAGAVAGVVLEHHLRKVCEAHGLATKKTPSLSDYNDLLNNAEIVDLPNWRWLQRLTDIRNLSVHAKDREPTADEISELIEGVDKAIKVVF